MEYVKDTKQEIEVDYDLVSMSHKKKRSYKQKYKTVENMIDKLKLNIDIINYIINKCKENNLSQNQTAVILAHAFAESGFRPNVTNRYGFHGLWQFSKQQANNFKLRNSLEKQVEYLMEEVAQKNNPEDYTKKWISWHKGGNGWIAKHKETWDTSDLLFDLNRAFSYGWERFAVEGKGVSENLTRYELSQMFQEYLKQK